LLQIPGYHDFLPIHQGRQYAVFRVREESTGSLRIIKWVQPGPHAAHATAALRHEHEMLRGLAIPGVVRPIKLEEVEGILALVLEDAGPFDLEQHLGQEPLKTELLRLMGQEPPERDLEGAIAEESAAVSRLLRGRTREELLAAPSMQDSRLLAVMRLMSSIVMAAYFADQLRLFAFFHARMLHLSLEHGHSPYSSHAYVAYAMTLGVATGDYDTGMKLGETGVQLSRRYADPRQESRCLTTFAGGVNHWRAPYRANIPLLRRAMAAGLEGNRVDTFLRHPVRHGRTAHRPGQEHRLHQPLLRDP
jgi:hypothetical protein